MPEKRSNTGLIVALIVVSVWLISIILLMHLQVNFSNPLHYLLIFVQMHLYTGLFITAHDAMHGTVSANRKLNNATGQLCTMLYACFPFHRLNSKHHEHHKYVHTDRDPDYYEGAFFPWYLKFIREYLSVWQIIVMALIFNVLKLWINEVNLLLFWVLPSLLSTMQLFYFGTWLPHHGEHQNTHHSRSQSNNHLLAFFSCYFFGYHYEHHDSPGTPWWKLWKIKQAGN